MCVCARARTHAFVHVCMCITSAVFDWATSLGERHHHLVWAWPSTRGCLNAPIRTLCQTLAVVQNPICTLSSYHVWWYLSAIVPCMSMYGDPWCHQYGVIDWHLCTVKGILYTGRLKYNRSWLHNRRSHVSPTDIVLEYCMKYGYQNLYNMLFDVSLVRSCYFFSVSRHFIY